MKKNITGVVAEFNPLHKGHEYFLKTAKEQSNNDFLVVVMSGNFVQRGEPAMFDKWVRTKSALECGADLVLELPTLFATSTAETFATASIRILGESNIVNSICFGSESGDLSTLEQTADILTNESKEFKELLKAQLNTGISYPLARSNALNELSNISKLQLDILSQPNHILGLEYLIALKKYNFNHIKPITIKRIGSGYHETELINEHTSATAIRKSIQENNINKGLSYIPQNSKDTFKIALTTGKAPISQENLIQILNYKIRTMSSEDIKNIYEVTEGLEHRIIKSQQFNYESEDLINYIKSKRYTRTKVQRILTHILLDITHKEIDYFLGLSKLPYIRVLGFKKESSTLLKELTEKSGLPILTNIKNANKVLNKDGLRLLEKEIIATDIYKLGSPNLSYRHSNQEFKNPLVII